MMELVNAQRLTSEPNTDDSPTEEDYGLAYTNAVMLCRLRSTPGASTKNGMVITICNGLPGSTNSSSMATCWCR